MHKYVCIHWDRPRHQCWVWSWGRAHHVASAHKPRVAKQLSATGDRREAAGGGSGQHEPKEMPCKRYDNKQCCQLLGYAMFINLLSCWEITFGATVVNYISNWNKWEALAAWPAASWPTTNSNYGQSRVRSPDVHKRDILSSSSISLPLKASDSVVALPIVVLLIASLYLFDSLVCDRQTCNSNLLSACCHCPFSYSLNLNAFAAQNLPEWVRFFIKGIHKKQL